MLGYNITLSEKEAIMLSILLYEIPDKSLEMILRRTLFTKEEQNVRDIIKQERPEYSEEKINKLEAGKRY